MTVDAPRLDDRPFTPPEVGVRRLETFVSPYVGIVNDAHELLRRPQDAGLVRFNCEPTTSAALLGESLEHLRTQSGGIATDRGQARAAAIGETLERYAASFLPPSAVTCRSRDLGPAAVEPRSFALFDAGQYATPGFRYRPFTPETVVRWLPAIELPDGDLRYVPAQRSLLAYHLAADEPPIDELVSTGLACGQTLEEATLTGLFEAIERDVFSIAWMARLRMPLLEWRHDPQLRSLAARYFDPVGVAYGVVDLSSFWDVPAALAFVRGRRGDGAALAVGAACAATMRDAWLKALGEAFCVRMWLLYLRQHAPWPPFRDPGRVSAFVDHVRYWADEEHLHDADFLWSGDRRTRVEEVPSLRSSTPLGQIAELCGRLRREGLPAFAVDLTTTDVRAGGLAVARAVVPGLVPMEVAHGARHLGAGRVFTAGRDLGLLRTRLATADLNPHPHPFP